ncbi:MerR family DNA-binding protein [Snodgrassella sp. CFCC 13594]|uniref:MerR family DNA-binding protein n=1 Tax=Snodgrassella sp. CFCC 13594 TaxID=1775559 RepID=UPI000832FE7E|nr:MerR family DNA-binding protein [Snodgrassella sp. CFCC 13594]
MINISQAASAVGLSTKAIRDYETANLIHPMRADNGYRLYNANDIETLRFIKHARDVDFSLAQITQLLALRNNPQRASADVKTLVGQHIHMLTHKIERLSSMRTTLQGWYDQCGGNHQPDCAILTGLSKAADHGANSQPAAKVPKIR